MRAGRARPLPLYKSKSTCLRVKGRCFSIAISAEHHHVLRGLFARLDGDGGQDRAGGIGGLALVDGVVLDVDLGRNVDPAALLQRLVIVVLAGHTHKLDVLHAAGHGKASGHKRALAGLGGLADLSQMQAMSQNFQSIPGVYSVTAPVEMTNVFVQVQRSVTKVGRGIVLVLMVVSIITVGSTIRLSVFARRREIEIMKYVGATNGLVTLPFVVEGLAMGLISGVLTAAISLGGYSYMVQASDGLGGVWEMIMGQALVPVSAVWSTIIPYSLIGGAVVGGLGSMFSIRKHLNV